ncbi:hypothetical protein Pint_35299 [Pistacia integerrima]|uniref:Uncharacterized protein n=1 Tax=Pistacia integerrima TaxID=434235 RepID=A0ACC0Y1X1_9ROSI|nr:hypothetical protein Pint_35299 [Pistacia integerrima]
MVCTYLYILKLSGLIKSVQVTSLLVINCFYFGFSGLYTSTSIMIKLNLLATIIT